MIVVTSLFYVTNLGASSTNQTATSQSGQTETVEYRVTGTTKTASVTFQTPSGTTQADIDVPLRNKAGAIGVSYQFAPSAFLYLSAQNQQSFGSVTCTILVNGQVVSTNTATGGYVIAQCER